MEASAKNSRNNSLLSIESPPKMRLIESNYKPVDIILSQRSQPDGEYSDRLS